MFIHYKSLLLLCFLIHYKMVKKSIAAYINISHKIKTMSFFAVDLLNKIFRRLNKPERYWAMHSIISIRLTLLIVFLPIAVISASADVTTLSTWTNIYHGTSDSPAGLTYTIPTGSNTNRVLIVGIASTQAAIGARTVTITYGGQTLIPVNGDMTTATTRQHTQLYYLNEAGIDAASSTTLAVTLSGGSARANDIFAAVYDAADQTNPITNSQNYNSITTAVSPFSFATGLTVNTGEQAVKVICTVRANNTTARTISNFGTNWTSSNEQTTANTDGIRDAVGYRAIPASNTTDISTTTLSGTALSSMTGLSVNNYVPMYFRSLASGNWNSTSTWQQSTDNVNWVSATSTPTIYDNSATIQSGHIVTVTTAGAAAISVTDNGSLDLGTFTLTGTGTLTIGSTGTLLVGGSSNFPTGFVTTTLNAGSTVNYDNDGTQTVSGINYSNLILSGTGAKTLQAGTTTLGGNLTLSGTATATLVTSLSIAGDMNIGTGTSLDLATFTANRATAGGTLTIAGTLLIGGTSNFPANYSTNSFTGGTVNYDNAGIQTVAAFNFNNLILSGSGVKTLQAGTTTLGSLTLSGSATTTTVGALSITGNLSVGTGTTLATGATNTWTIAVGGTTDVTGTLTLANTGTKTFSGDVTLNSGALWNETGIAAIGFGGSFTNNATTFTSNTGIHTLSGATKTLSGATTTAIPTVTFTGAYTNTGTLTSATLLTVTGTTLTNNGTITATTALSGTGGLTQGTTGILNIGGTAGITSLTATATGNTVNFTGGAQTVNSINYYNLTLSGSGAKTLNTGTTAIGGTLALSGTATTTAVIGLTIGADLTIGTGTTFTAGSYTHNIAGNFSNSATFTAGTSTINLNGTTQSISGATTFNILTLAGSGTKTFVNNTITNGNFSINSGVVANLGTGLTHTAKALYFAGVKQGTSTWGGTGSAASNINTTYFAASTGILNTTKNWTGTTSIDWNVATNWSDGAVPTSADDVIIPNVTNKPTIGATSSCDNITINVGSSLTITGSNLLNVNGNWTNNGTFTANTSTVSLSNGAQTVSGTNTFNNLTIGGTGLKTFATTPTVSGILSMEGTGTVSAAPTYSGAAATLQYNTTTARAAGPEWVSPFIASGGIIIASTGAISLNSAEAVTSNLTISSGSTLNTSASNFALSFGGNFTNNGGTFTANGSAITINGAGTQSIAGFTTTGGVTCTKASGTATLTGNVNAATLSLTGATGTLNLGTGLTHTISGNWSSTAGTTLNGGSSIINIAGTSTIAGTFTAATGTVNYNAAGVQTTAAVVYYNLSLSGSGAKTLQTASAAIGGSLTLSGTATATTVAATTIAGNLTVGTGTTFTTGATNSWTLGVTGTTSVTGTLTLANTGTKTFTGNVTLNSGAAWNETNAATIAIAGSFANSATTFTASTGSHNFTGTGKTLSGSTITAIPTANITGTYTNNGTLTITTALNGTGGTLTQGTTGVLNVGFTGAMGLSTLTANAVGNTVNYNFAGNQTVKTGNYYNLTLATSGTKTLTVGTTAIGGNFTLSTTTPGTTTTLTTGAVALSINGDVTIGNGTTFTSGAFSHTVNGNWTNNGGTFTPGIGTINMTGTAKIIDGTAASNTFYNLTINSGGTTLGKNATVTNNLILRSGVLTTTSSALLSVTNTASTAISSTANTSFISGPVKWTLPASLASGSTYLFPVGKGTTYLPFSLVNPTTGTGTVTAQVEAFNTNSSGGKDATLSAISSTEYWALLTSGNFTNSNISVSKTTAIAPNDVLAGNATAANGTYTSLYGTIGAYGISNSDLIGTNRYFVLAQGVPTIALSTSTLSGFSYPYGTGPSSEKTFTVRGNSLSTNITLTAATDYEISTTSGVSFVATSPISLAISGAAVPTTTIYVRLKAGLAIGSYSTSELITASASGATSKTVTCSGTVGNAPTITVSPTSLSGFTYVYTKGPTAQQTFTVSGINLAGNVTVTPPSDYQISTTNGSGYAATPIPLTPTGGTLASTTIYVIMPSGLGVGSHNQNITASAVGATDKTVALTGTVTAAPTLTTATSYLAGFIYTFGAGPSGEQSFVLNGTNLSTTLRNDTIVAPANFEISTTSGSGFTTGSIILTRAAGVSTRSTTIYVRMVTGLGSSTITTNFGPANVSLKSSGAIIKTVALAGTVVASSPSTPTVLTSIPTLTGFGYMQGTGPSSEQKFTVSGTSLSAGIIVTPPSNYEISTTSGSGFQSTPITISLTSGRVNPTLVYVRLKSALTAGSYTGVNITVASTGAPTKNVALVGTVFISPLVTAGGGGTYCAGDTIRLTSTGADIQNRYWQGPNSFYSTTQNPKIGASTPSMSGTYTVTGNVNVGGNLVFNGDFELGRVGFGSGYTYVDTTSTSALVPEGDYTVVKLPHSVHNDFTTWPDHTTGRGLQMVVNGAPVAGVVVWSQSVPVIPGATYAFTYWEQTVNITQVPKNASQLQLYVNGVAAGPVYTAPQVNYQWAQFLYNAAAGSNTVLNLELINQNTVLAGNDFALDDIVFGQILPATSTTDVTVNPILPVSVTVAASANPVFKNTPVTYTATPTNGGSTPTYQWYVNSSPVGTNSTSYTYIPNDKDTVKCVLTSSLTCVSNNPANASVIATVITRTNYWYGYTDTDWAKARNWTGNYVPLPGDDVEYATVANTDSVAINDLWLDKNRTIGSLINATTKALIIPAAKGLQVNNYTITDGDPNRIDILSSSTLANGSLHFNQPTQNTDVNATVEMYSKATWDLTQPVNSKYRWQYFGIPVTTVTAMPTFMGSYVRKWYEIGTNITNHWIQLGNDSTLDPFYGYEICQAAPTTIVFQGTLVTSDFSSGQMAITPTALYPGQHVYANSYTAGISIKDLDYGSDVENTAFLYNTGTYNQWLPDQGNTSGLGTGEYLAVPKNLAGYSTLPAQVASMQSILIKAISPTSNASFGIRYTSTVVDFDSAIHRIKGTFNNPFDNSNIVSTIIDVKGSKTADRLWLVSQPGCTRTFDNGWDGTKFIGSAISPQLYAIEPDGKYQVNAVDDINDTEIGFLVGVDTEYNLTFNHSNIKSKYAGVYLVDLLDNKTIDVTESGTSYSFTATSSTPTDKRFKIVARHYEENAPDTESQIKVFSSNGNIFVQNFDNSKGDILLYDIAGHYLEKLPLVPNGIITLSGIVPGAYIARVITAKEDFSKRLIVR